MFCGQGGDDEREKLEGKMNTLLDVEELLKEKKKSCPRVADGCWFRSKLLKI